jgi:uncharacterized membrane protein YidH (DUF202 family)
MFKVILLAVGIVIVALDGYQAVTGRRVSRRPSRRTDREMRVQSAIAAVVFGFICLLLVIS